MAATFSLWSPMMTAGEPAEGIPADGSWLATAVNTQGIHDGTPAMIAAMLKSLKVTGVADWYEISAETPSFTPWLSESEEDEGDWRDAWLPTWKINMTFEPRPKPRWPGWTLAPISTTAFDDTWGEGDAGSLEELRPRAFDLYCAAAGDKAIAKLEVELAKRLGTKGFEPLIGPAWTGKGKTRLVLARVPVASPKKVEACVDLMRQVRASLRKSGVPTHWRDA